MIVGTTITPPVVVYIEDHSGDIVATDNSIVTLAVNSPSGAMLGGTLSVQAVDGVATFSGLVPNSAGTYTLATSDGSLSSTSSNFSVNARVASSLEFVQQPNSAVAGAGR